MTSNNSIQCYEELRFNVLFDPFYVSQSRNLLQSRGMLWWIKNVEIVYAEFSYEEFNTDVLSNFSSSHNKKGVQNRLCSLLANIIVTIHPEVLYV